MRRMLSLVAFVITASLIAAVSERGLCFMVECDTELMGYILNDPIILFAYSALGVLLCFIPSVWLSKRIGRNASISMIPLAFAVLVMLIGIINNAESVAIVGLWVCVPLLVGNVVGLHLWTKLSVSMESKNT